MSDDILDLNDFMERVQNDKELLLELLDIFTSDFEEKRRELEDAFNRNDPLTVEHVAHFLKGSCSNISAGLLRQLFFELEKKGRDNDLSDKEKYLNAIDREYQQLVNYLGEIRGRLQ
jgi:HPt (histidine-containing phosphotransfer) domain-containing protein